MLFHILKLCHLWIIPDGIRFAISGLNSHSLPASQLLELGGKYAIRSWVTASTLSLLKQPLKDWSAEDLSRIPLQVYSLIAKAREAITIQRNLFACRPPSFPNSIHSSKCQWSPNTIQACTTAWNDGWWKVVAKALVHPLTPLSIGDIPEHVPKKPFLGVSVECYDKIITYLRSSNAIHTEQAISEELLVLMLEYYGLPPIPIDNEMEF